ncbi:hypothetical protein AX15_006229 [Amanita polypyramis BW_CC]|nr:hypothetical protein AX15_006229 [Amanita polypyramis BW_CC]
MTGDFNMPSNHWDDNHPSRHPQGDTLLDLCFMNNLTLLNHNGQHTWGQSNRSSLLDLVFISGHIADSTLLQEGDFLEASNHCPLWLHFPTNLYAPYCAIIPNSPAEDMFLTLIQNIWAEVVALPQQDIPEGFDRSFELFEQRWQEYSTVHSPSTKSKSWWTHQLTETWALVQQGQIPHSQLRAEIRTAKRQYFDGLIQKLAHHKRPWDAVKWTKPRPTPCHIIPLVDSNNQTLSIE